MNTAFLLFAQYEKAAIPLIDFARDNLGLDEAQAKRKAGRGELPFPVFREGQKGPYLVTIADAAEWMDRAANQARRQVIA